MLYKIHRSAMQCARPVWLPGTRQNY